MNARRGMRANIVTEISMSASLTHVSMEALVKTYSTNTPAPVSQAIQVGLRDRFDIFDI